MKRKLFTRTIWLAPLAWSGAALAAGAIAQEAVERDAECFAALAIEDKGKPVLGREAGAFFAGRVVAGREPAAAAEAIGKAAGIMKRNTKRGEIARLCITMYQLQILEVQEAAKKMAAGG